MKIQDLSDCCFEEIANANNLDLENCTCLKNDEYAYIDSNNKILFKCPVSRISRATFDGTYNDFTGGTLFPESETFNLHSRPSSTRRIYLDFRGGILTNTRWNTYYNRTSISYSTFSIGTTPQNNQFIQKVWKAVAEDYAPFDIDVTTDPATPYNARCLITNNTSNQIFNDGSYGGVAFFNKWGLNFYKDCWCFNPNSNDLRSCYQTISHEVGHILGLLHQGTNTEEYYSGSNGWGPIMGAPFYQQMSQWTYVPQTYTGTSTQPSINQNDLVLINEYLPYISDDYPSTIQLASSTDSIISTSINTYYGTISQNTDVDFFKFESGPGNITITGLVSAIDPNLNLQLTLYNANYNEITTGTKTGLNSTINYTVLANGIYYIKVDGIGSTYYTDYNSMGKYKLTFNLQPSSLNTSIIPNKTSIYKGETVTFNITNSNNTQLYWKKTGTSIAGDFVGNTTQGVVMIANNSGSFSLTSIDDFIQSVSKTFKIELFTDAAHTDKVTESTNVTLNSNTYSITPNKNNIFEGEIITFNITGTSNRVLYWKNIGTSDSDDFNDIDSGTVTVSNNIGNIILSSKNDLDTEIPETIILGLYINADYTIKVAESIAVTLNNNLNRIIANKTSIFEGDNVTFNITTSNITNNTILYWKNVGSSNASDFTNNAITGFVTINNNAANFSLISKINPIFSEGQETIKIQLFTNSSHTNQIAETNIIYLNKLQIVANKTSIIEGEQVVFTITTNNVQNGTIIYWKNNGTSSTLDFNNNIYSGEITINNNSGTLTLISSIDTIIESQKTIIIGLYISQTYGTIIGNSSIVYLNNITITPNVSSISEGDTVTFNIISNLLPNNTQLYWNIFGTANNSDFNETINNTFRIINNRASIVLSVKYGLTVQKTFKIQIFTDSLRTIKVTESTIVTMNKLNYTIVPRQTSINEGSSLIFDITTNDNSNILYWSNVGTCVAADFTNNRNNGTVTISNKIGTLTLAIKNDLKFEGDKTVKIQLRKAVSQPLIIESSTVTINDTSVPTIRITSSPASSLVEGARVTFTVTASANNNYKLYWTNNGSTEASDFIENKINGELIFNNNRALFSLTSRTDSLTEPNETIIINIRQNSISGPIIGTRTVTIGANNRSKNKKLK
jgi:hypothetical protein